MSTTLTLNPGQMTLADLRAVWQQPVAVQLAAEAARALGISQPAVHQTLAQLEHMAGAALFVRARKGLRLTETGEATLQAFKLARAELQQAGDALAAQRGVVQGRLVIGTLPFSTGHLLSLAVDRVLQTHPGVAITIVDGTYDALLHQLRQADIDLIVGALRPALPGADLQQETLFLDRLAVAPAVQDQQHHGLGARHRAVGGGSPGGRNRHVVGPYDFGQVPGLGIDGIVTKRLGHAAPPGG